MVFNVNACLYVYEKIVLLGRSVNLTWSLPMSSFSQFSFARENLSLFSRTLFCFVLGVGAGAVAVTTASAITYPTAASFYYGNSSVPLTVPEATSNVSGTGLNFRFIKPPGYNPAVKYPLVIFLHGNGESRPAELSGGGPGNTWQLNNNANGAMALVSTASPANQTNYPCFFVAPQSTGGWTTPPIQDIINLFKATYSIDDDRICLTGLSGGSIGAWAAVNALPNTFASLVSLSGGGNGTTTAPLAVWAFHAANDSTVGVNGSDSGVQALRQRGISVIYTRYNSGGHGIWPTAYQHPQLMPWIYAQKRGEAMQGLPSLNITGSQMGLSPLVLTGTAQNSGSLTFSKVGWNSSRITGTPSGTDGVANNTTTFTSASTTFSSATHVGYRLAISVLNGSVTNKHYYTITAVDPVDVHKVTLDRILPATTGAFTLYKPGIYTLLNLSPGTNLSGNYATWSSSVPLSSGANIIHAFAEGDSGSASLGGFTSLNEAISLTYAAPTGDTVAPTIAVTTPATSSSTTTSTSINLAGTASDNVAVTAITWASDRGPSGSASGLGPWSATAIALSPGLNVITVTAKDAKNNQGSALLRITRDMSVAPNQAPVVNAGSDQAIVQSGSATLAGSVTDDGLAPGNPTPTASWAKLSGPGTVTFGNANVASTSATFSVGGTYVLRLTGDDGVLSTTDDVTVTVAHVPVLFDVGLNTFQMTGNWNNVTNASVGVKIANAINSNGTSTGIEFSVTAAFAGINSSGSTSTTGAYPANAMVDSLYVQNTTVGKVKLAGLNPATTYTLSFFGSRMNGGTGRTTGYKIGTTELILDANNNETNIATFPNLTPAVDGTIEVEVRSSTGAGSGYLGVVEIE
jgi:poly(3-hydroxybutyrate) depolymerase